MLNFWCFLQVCLLAVPSAFDSRRLSSSTNLPIAGYAWPRNTAWLGHTREPDPVHPLAWPIAASRDTAAGSPRKAFREKWSLASTLFEPLSPSHFKA